MIFKSIKWGCLGAFLTMGAPAFSAGINTLASLATPLDNSGVSARAAGMGWAFVGVADDSSALFWNPAGLAGLPYTEVALHHNSWLAGIIQETAVMTLPVGALGGLGASVNYVNYGSFSGYDNSGNPTADFSANRYAFNLGWGKEILPQVSAGVAVKGSVQSIADTSYTNFSADFGALWTPVKDFRVGLAYSNLGTGVAGFAPASVLRLGASYDLAVTRNNQLLLACSSAFVPQGVNRLQIGFEDVLGGFLALRLGYQDVLADNQLQGLSGLTTGLGVMYEGLHLDYAYLPYGDLDSAHRISLSYEFGSRAKAAPEMTSSELYDQGLRLEKSGNSQEAISSYHASIKKNASDPRPWRALGGIYFKDGKTDLTISSFEEVLRLDAGDQKLRTWLRNYKATRQRG